MTHLQLLQQAAGKELAVVGKPRWENLLTDASPCNRAWGRA